LCSLSYPFESSFFQPWNASIKTQSKLTPNGLNWSPRRWKVGDPRDTRVKVVASAFQKILRGPKLTWYMYTWILARQQRTVFGVQKTIKIAENSHVSTESNSRMSRISNWYQDILHTGCHELSPMMEGSRWDLLYYIAEHRSIVKNNLKILTYYRHFNFADWKINSQI